MGEEESDTESDDWDFGSVSQIRRFLLVSQQCFAFFYIIYFLCFVFNVYPKPFQL